MSIYDVETTVLRKLTIGQIVEGSEAGLLASAGCLEKGQNNTITSDCIPPRLLDVGVSV
jgi:hypothetical protein